MSKLRTYAILTTDSNRIEVKAHNIDDAYRKARKKLKDFVEEHSIMVSENSDLTKSYMTFGRSGVNTEGFKTTEASTKAWEKYKLEKYYCENCGKEDLKEYVIDDIGSVFCSYNCFNEFYYGSGSGSDMQRHRYIEHEHKLKQRPVKIKPKKFKGKYADFWGIKEGY